MQRRDIATALFATTTAAALVSKRSEAASCGQPACFNPSPAEISAGVTIYQTQYWPGDIRRYWSGSGDYTAAIQAALNCAQDVYLPTGTWPISSSLNVYLGNGTNRRIYGDGMEVSIIQVGGNNGAPNLNAFFVSGGAQYLRITMEDFQIYNFATSGSGIGVYFGGSYNSGVLVYESMFKNVYVQVPGQAFYLPNLFSTQFINCQGWSRSSNVFELAGGSGVKLQGCYAHSVSVGYWGYRIYGGALLDSCNGIDGEWGGNGVDGNGGNWGCFGASTTAGDAFNQNYAILMINCNVEDFNTEALYFRSDGFAKLINCTFTAKQGGTYRSEIHIQYCDQIISLDSVQMTTPIGGATRTAPAPIYVDINAQVMCHNSYTYNSSTGVFSPITTLYNGGFSQSQTVPNFTTAYMASGADQFASHCNSLAATQFYNFYSGSKVLSSGTATVQFATNQFDNNYLVLLTGNKSETFYVTNPQTNGFQINSSSSTSTATVNWFISRNSPT